MRNSSNQTASGVTTLQIAICSIWLIFTIMAFAVLVDDQLVEFDGENKLTEITPNALQQQLIGLVGSPVDTPENQVIHFQRNDCHCNRVTATHVQSLAKLAESHGFSVNTVELEDTETIVPSSPAVAIIESGKLLYFGPYGQGVSCSETSGFAQTVFENAQKGYKDEIIMRQASGCYCA
ncbi:DUF6436 domain-containing protein [Thalassotalea euphylliae]|uniref:DUF6436 domain-containing protein n=1 Tax=Thalassotalea euphylliae TaxID=1655234 RepID=UPI003631619C